MATSEATGPAGNPSGVRSQPGLADWLTRLLAGLTVGILAYSLLSALNARATYLASEHWFRFFDHYIRWLPHSYDRASTLFFFWNHLGLACFFWALRDWLLGKTGREHRASAAMVSGRSMTGETPLAKALPQRLQRLLWVVCLNAGLLALVCTLQRLSGTNRLLWLIVPHWNKTNITQFGPYAYRGNAAEFFNLIWPLCLGFWSALQRQGRPHGPGSFRIGSQAHVLLLPCTVLTAAAPIISTSRGGALISMIGIVVAVAILLLAYRKAYTLVRLGILCVFLVAISLAGYLGWAQLAKRFRTVFTDDLSHRKEIYVNAEKIAREYPVLGTGPGTFASIYQFYRKPDQYWQAFVHDDFFETRITFGWIGYPFVLLALGLVLARWFVPGGIRLVWEMPALLYLAVLGCLLQARYDFPLRIHSVLLIFLLECCLLFCSSRK